ncbi:carboxynorspermidine decarboxylase [Pseudobutyrivibrio sp. OR37]|uniref:carboxynorspermidine decarboxylase n=1 Tax=Pseudobutyrivibrio sp. OR37 TaxID=1798186 RepID=UPI0008ED03D2|nr:carboxynorspermidine decarboxylase [Pseudobutyrivibrio sp. OR37]SFH56937.1 carboxynorspermidine decarboxylase [Pseudobutyrivibrio sp. OR37]
MFTSQIETPSYVIDESKLIENLKVLERVQKEASCKILLAQKAFSNFVVYPLIGQYLAGTTASGIYEARLGKEEMGKENHVFAPAYKSADMDELVKICDHIIFNSVAQLMKYKDTCLKAQVEIGLRVNPQCSTQGDHAIYDPCADGSRLGVTLKALEEALSKDASVLDGVSGLHFHTLCEQNSDDLETTLVAFTDKFGKFLPQMKWVNMGGGHHITRADYDVDRLIRLVKELRAKYDVQVYLEPGEAIALNAGYFVTEVLDIVENGIKTLILDGSAACHMPDVLEMPYRPPLRDSGEWGEKPFEYRLSSYTCLAGDIIGDYSFDHEIQVGDRLIFEDMAIYSMVKNNTFNGIPLPSIYLLHADGEIELVKKFGYEDFKNRLS